MRILLIAAAALAAALGAASAQGEDERFGVLRTQVETSVGYETSFGGMRPPQPPAGELDLVTYPSEVGALAAYVTPNPGDGQLHPAIIWMTGGETNTIDEVWSPRPRANDQSAAQFRRAGIVTMYPSLRGGNANPGRIEAFVGEIDDLIAAADYLVNTGYVDPSRIYLGGHSTGGTLVFLAAAASDRFRATFSMGPAASAHVYGPDIVPVNFEALPSWETVLRAPAAWMDSVRTPLFVIEGAGGNSDHLHYMRERNTNPRIVFLELPDADHFSYLAPANEAIARAILADTGRQANIALSADTLMGR